MRVRSLVAGLAVALVAVFALEGAATAEPESDARQGLRMQGKSLVDQHGRVVLLHGVNNVDKDAPYIQPGDGFTLTAADAALLAGHGFNTVRLGVEFDGLMPQQGAIDTAYLDRIATEVDLLGKAGIHVLLDLHQDGLSKPWGGNGFPAWAIKARPAPWEPNPGFPLSYLMPSMNLGWDEVWNDTHGVLGYFGDSLAALADRVGSHPAVLGIELLNEPWPGTAFPTCYPAGCPLFDRKYQAVHEQLTTRIRAAAPELPVFWEPNVTWNETMPSHLGEPPLTPPISARQVGFSFHDYCLASQAAIYLHLPPELIGMCPLQHDRNWSNVDTFARRTGMPALVTEFGDTDASVLRHTLDRADAHFVGWQYWHYQSVFGPKPGTDPFTGEVGKQLVRSYPQATAGVPGPMSFDAVTGLFRYTYQPEPSSAPTEIYVSDQHYPRGYVAEVSGGRVTSAPGARKLTVEPTGTGPVTVTVRAA